MQYISFPIKGKLMIILTDKTQLVLSFFSFSRKKVLSFLKITKFNTFTCFNLIKKSIYYA